MTKPSSPVSLLPSGKMHFDQSTGKAYISDGVAWFEVPAEPGPVSGSSFQVVSTPASTAFDPFLKAWEREWLRLNPDGWWPNPYEEERAWADLEAEHELMRVWCEENATQ